MPTQTSHPTHVTRISFDASSYDEICINCFATDEVPGGWGKLADPCPKPVGAGGITIEEYNDRSKNWTKAVNRTDNAA